MMRLSDYELQYGFILDMDQANTYTHHSNLSVLNLRTILGSNGLWTLQWGGWQLT